jgi:D-sedoheptulose 7-phosphate isomerase
MNLELLQSKLKNPNQFSIGYFEYLSMLFKQLDISSIAGFIEELENVRQNQGTIFIIGNGGSAATASHMANDLCMITHKVECQLKPFRALALTDNNALMTAVANDDGYKSLFTEQLKVHYRSGDILIAISVSGNSPNVVEAVNWVKSKKGKTIGLTGFDSGEMKALCDVLIHVQTPKGEFGPVEDIHMIIDHLVTCWFQGTMKQLQETL